VPATVGDRERFAIADPDRERSVPAGVDGVNSGSCEVVDGDEALGG
jgi:hypothetical protein